MKLTKVSDGSIYPCVQIGYGEVSKKRYRIHFWIHEIQHNKPFPPNPPSYWIILEPRYSGDSYLKVQQNIISEQKNLVRDHQARVDSNCYFYLLESVAYETLKRCCGTIGDFVWLD